jgi:hypothetical protein
MMAKGTPGRIIRCSGVVEEFAIRRYRGGLESFVLLRHVTAIATGAVVADHLWLFAGPWSEPLKSGDIIAFDVRPGGSGRGWMPKRPTGVVVLGSLDLGPGPRRQR